MWRQNIQRPSSFRPSHPSQEFTFSSTTLTNSSFEPRPVAKRRGVFEGCTFYVCRKRDEPGETFFDTFINRIRALGGRSTNDYEDTTITHYLVVVPDCYVRSPGVPILETDVAGCKKWQRIVREHAKWAHDSGYLDKGRNIEERRKKVVVRREWIQDVLTGLISIREEGQWGVYLQSDRPESSSQADEGEASDPVRRAVDPRIRPKTITTPITSTSLSTSISASSLHHAIPPTPTYSIAPSPTYIAVPLPSSPESLHPQPSPIKSPNPFFTPETSVNESSPPRSLSRKRSRLHTEDEEDDDVAHKVSVAQPRSTKRQSFPSGWARADSPLTPLPSCSSSRSASRSRVTSGSSVTSTSSSTLTSASTSTSTSVSFSSGSCSSAHEFGSDIEMQPQTFTEAMSRVSYRALLGEMCRSTCPP